MGSKVLLVVAAMLVLLIVGLTSGPAFSGEHPWDSDRTGGGSGTTTGVTHDTVTVVGTDTMTINGSSTPTTVVAPGWTVIVQAVWSAMMTR